MSGCWELEEGGDWEWTERGYKRITWGIPVAMEMFCNLYQYQYLGCAIVL